MKFSTIAIGSASLFLIAAAVAQTAPRPSSFFSRKARLLDSGATCAAPDTNQ
jgi:hypothetical protein